LLFIEVIRRDFTGEALTFADAAAHMIEDPQTAKKAYPLGSGDTKCGDGRGLAV
jgi:hypothetical protein